MAMGGLLGGYFFWSGRRALPPRPAVVPVRLSSDFVREVGSGEDPRDLFQRALGRYLAGRAEQREIHPMLVHLDDESALLRAEVHGMRYVGRLRWGNRGWEIAELSTEPAPLPSDYRPSQF